MKPIINSYYYAPHNHSLLVEHLRIDLNRMRSLGVSAVSLCVDEQQLENWHRIRLERVIKEIRSFDMKVHAVPNRWAGLVAGWLDGFGRFSVDHCETLIQNENGETLTTRGNPEMQSCIHHPLVPEFLKNRIALLLKIFDFDGIIWDEPHDKICHCRYCRAASEDRITQEWQTRETAKLLDELCEYAKGIKNSVVTSVFVQPDQSALLNSLLTTQHIDYIGSDGHIRDPKHSMHRMKGTIFEAHAAFHVPIRDAGKKSIFLLEAQRHRDEDLENYLQNVGKAFSLPMDHLMFYYSAHEMLDADNESEFNQATWRHAKKAAFAGKS